MKDAYTRAMRAPLDRSPTLDDSNFVQYADDQIGYEAASPASYLPRDAAMQIQYVGPEPLLPAWAFYVGAIVMVALAAWAAL